MKILHVIPWVSAIRGGPGESLLQLVQRQIDFGQDVAILTTDDNGPGELEVILGKESRFQNVPVIFFHRFRTPFRFIRDYVVSWDLVQWLSKNHQAYDVIHIHGVFNFISSFSMLVMRRHRRKFILRTHGMLCEWSLRDKFFKKWIYFQLFEKRNLNGAKFIECTSEMEKDEIARLKLLPEAQVIPLGIDKPMMIANAKHQLSEKYAIPLGHKVAVFLGRIHYKKGIEFVLEALARLKSECLFTLIIAGEGTPEYTDQIRQRVHKLELDSNVRFAGHVSGEEKNMILQGGDLFVLTSFSESFGYAVLEAVVHGCPVLVSKFVPLASYIREYRLGEVCELNVSSIVDGLSRLYHEAHQPEGMQPWQLRMNTLVDQHFAWPDIISRLQQLYGSFKDEVAR